MSARIRTGYAFRHAAGKIEDVLLALQAYNGMGRENGRAPITDTASTYGWVKWDAAARKENLDPAFGVELAVSLDPTAKKPVVDYWTFLSRDSVVPLHGLIGVATEQFRYEPLLTIDQATSASSTVNVIMGHRAPVAAIVPRPGLWLGLGPGSTRYWVQQALGAGHEPVAVCDNRFPQARDRVLYELTCGRRASSQSYAQHILSDEEWLAMARGLDLDLDLPYTAIEHRNEVLAQSTAQLPRATMLKPERKGALREMCLTGAMNIGVNMLNTVYVERLKRELKLIKDKGFEDYFYLVADLVAWARERMLVGPARGSSCGSLVCYLLGITTIDPIPYGLLFERFIDVNRPDLPDIDIDFSDQHRDLIFDYLRGKYGPDRVARLGTVNMYQPRSALKELAIALDIPPWAVEGIADQAEKSSLKEALTGHPLVGRHHELWRAVDMEDHPKHAGQHAAGVVITAASVSQAVAVDRRTGATMCDKYDAEVLGLLKIDALGLTQLSIFEDALELAGLSRDSLQRIGLGDLKAFHILNTRRFAGVFQFNGPALQSLCTKVTVYSFDDIVALTALARPGPLDSGEAQRWVNIRIGKSKPTYPHPLFEPILKPTLGIVIYQEQVMQIARAVGMSWEEVSALRRLISKSAGVEALQQHRESFMRHGTAASVAESVLEEVWRILSASGAYSFNKSHAVAYAVISYWCCWLKAHHALEFAAATLTHAGDDMQLKLLRELSLEGVRYVPADKDKSTDKWTVADVGGRRTLIGPLSNIIGIGPQHMRTILSVRARPRIERLPDHVGKILHKMKTKVDDLWPIKTAIDRLMTGEVRQALVTPRSMISDVQVNGQPQVVLVVGLIDSLKKIDENSPDRVARRQGRQAGGPHALNLWITDDTDKIFAKVSWQDFPELGEDMLARGKGYYAIRGVVPADFRMIKVEKLRFIGPEGAGHDKNIAAE